MGGFDFSQPDAWSAAASVVYTALTFFTLCVLTWQVALLRKQIASSTASSEQQLRAYVTVELAGVHVIAGGAYEAKIVLINSGQTPARLTASWSLCSLERFPFDGTLVPRAEGLKPGTAPLGPGISLTLNPPVTRHFLAEETAGLGNGQAAMYVYGQFRYEDIFGKEHFTNFQLMFGGRHRWQAADELGPGWFHLHPDTVGNEAD